jgi:hypothetical protein
MQPAAWLSYAFFSCLGKVSRVTFLNGSAVFGGAIVGHQAKGECFGAIDELYQTAGRKLKQVIRNEFCLSSEYKPELRDSSAERPCSA